MKVLRNRAVIALLSFNLMAGMLFVGGALLVSFMRSFGTTPAQLGLILSTGWAASVFGALSGGYLTDRIGPRKMVLSSVALVALGLLGKSLSQHWLQAGAWYLLVMGAQAALGPAGRASLKAAVGEQVGSSLGFLNTALSAVAVPGAALTGWVVMRWGWSALFAAKFATYVVALFMLLLLLPEVRVQARAQERSANWRFALSNPALLSICVSVFVVTLGGYCHAFHPYFVQDRFGSDVHRLALFDSIYNGVWMLSNWPAGMLADRLGRGRIAASGYALMGLGWLLFPAAPSLLAIYAFYTIYCLGNSMGFYASVFALDVAPEQVKGRAGGLFDAAMYLGSTLGDGAGGLLWQHWGPQASFAVATLANGLGALLLLLPGRPEETHYKDH